MSIEWQVCSRELSIKLRKLGVIQDSYFYWAKNEVYNIWEVVHFERHWENNYSAFTVAELGNMLPPKLNAETEKQKASCFVCNKTCDQWMIAYVSDVILPPTIYTIEESEADARAKVIIYLIENEIIKKGVNSNDFM